MNKLALFALIFISYPSRAEEGIYEGIIGFGPEASYFYGCELKEYWWLHRDSWNSKGWEDVMKVINKQPICNLENMPCKHQSAFVRAEVSLSKSGEYGHLGEYAKEAKVLEVIEVHKLSGQCAFQDK